MLGREGEKASKALVVVMRLGEGESSGLLVNPQNVAKHRALNVLPKRRTLFPSNNTDNAPK